MRKIPLDTRGLKSSSISSEMAQQNGADTSLGATGIRRAPPREHGLQNAIESFNGRWQAKVWARFHYDSLESLRAQSALYIAASQTRSAPRREAAPERREFPRRWKFAAQGKVRGRLIYIRRTNDKGEVSVLGNQFQVAESWAHRLVRCEIDIAGQEIRCYALRRKAPEQQPLL